MNKRKKKCKFCKKIGFKIRKSFNNNIKINSNNNISNKINFNKYQIRMMLCIKIKATNNSKIGSRKKTFNKINKTAIHNNIKIKI